MKYLASQYGDLSSISTVLFRARHGGTCNSSPRKTETLGYLEFADLASQIDELWVYWQLRKTGICGKFNPGKKYYALQLDRAGDTQAIGRGRKMGEGLRYSGNYLLIGTTSERWRAIKEDINASTYMFTHAHTAMSVYTHMKAKSKIKQYARVMINGTNQFD